MRVLTPKKCRNHCESLCMHQYASFLSHSPSLSSLNYDCGTLKLETLKISNTIVGREDLRHAA